MDMDWCLRL